MYAQSGSFIYKVWLVYEADIGARTRSIIAQTTCFWPWLHWRYMYDIGGGECTTQDACETRVGTKLGSSKYFDPKMQPSQLASSKRKSVASQDVLYKSCYRMSNSSELECQVILWRTQHYTSGTTFSYRIAPKIYTLAQYPRRQTYDWFRGSSSYNIFTY